MCSHDCVAGYKDVKTKDRKIKRVSENTTEYPLSPHQGREAEGLTLTPRVSSMWSMMHDAGASVGLTWSD